MYIAKEAGAPDIDDIKIAASLSEISLFFLSENNFTLQKQDIMRFAHKKTITLLRDFTVLGKALKILTHIYETLDGKGIPDRLKKDEIPIGSLIISIARAFVFYHFEEGLDVEKSLLKIEKGCGILYDVKYLYHLEKYIHNHFEDIDFAEVDIFNLKKGMKLAKSIYTVDGAKFLPSDTQIDDYHLGKIDKYNKNNLLIRKVFIKA